jgi:site-specific recombinase XerD
MPDLPVPRAGGGSAPSITDVLSSAATYARAEKSEATRTAYKADFDHFCSWCQSVGRSPLPASVETTAAYLAHLADSGLKVSTINRRSAGIGYAHKLAGFEPPTNAEPVKAVARGIRRKLGTAVTQKEPATDRAIARMLKGVAETPSGLRDKALLLLGFSAALRRSELAALDVPDVERHTSGLIVHIRRAKTDQEGQGAHIAVPRGRKLQVVEAVEAWLAVIGRLDGPLFVSIGKGQRVSEKRLSDKDVARVVKRHAARVRLDPKIFSGHSLRAGFITSALTHGADIFKVMDVSRHTDVKTLRVYDRRAKAFKDHAGKRFL